MANPTYPAEGSGAKIDALTDAAGAVHLKLAVGTQSGGGASNPPAWAGSATHVNGTAVGASDGVSVAAGKNPSGNAVPIAADAAGRVLLGLPIGTDVTASATGAASALAPALPAVAAMMNYVTGFEVTGGGATGASIIAVTLTGTISGTLNYRIAIPAGVTLGITPLIVEFSRPIPASAVNTAITLNVASFGAGNTDAAATIHGLVL